MKSLFTFLCSALIFSVLGLSAASAADAKTNMRERIPVIDKLKTQGLVGENNQGYLEVRKAGGNAATVVAAENKDRKAVFEQAAKRAGISSDAIGKSFARQIAEASVPGVWIQKEDGSWYKK